MYNKVDEGACAPTASAPSSRRGERSRARRHGLLAVGAVVALLAAGCGSSSSSTSGSSGTTIGSGSATTTGGSLVSKSLTNVTLEYESGFNLSTFELLAQKEGFFAKNGLKVKLVPSESSSAQAAALTSGSVDGIIVTADGAFPFIVSGHIDMQVVTGFAKQFFEIAVNNTIPKSDTTFPAVMHALKGKTILVSPIGGSPYYLLLDALKAAGMTPSEVHIVNVDHGLPQIAALENNNGQAAVLDGPDAESVISAGKGRVLVDFAKPGTLPSYLANTQFGAFWMEASYIKAHPTVVAALRTAFAETDVWSKEPSHLKAYEAVLSGVMGSETPAAQIPALAQNTLEDSVAYFTVASAQGWYKFDLKAETVKATPGFNPANYVAPGTPASESDVQALVSKAG
jgi:ABC-type nitrate/sulfonate/bicarbonate transport system substrate-binding protein